jgi:hypothetical protein
MFLYPFGSNNYSKVIAILHYPDNWLLSIFRIKKGVPSRILCPFIRLFESEPVEKVRIGTGWSDREASLKQKGLRFVFVRTNMTT